MASEGETTGVADVLKLLLEDRERRDKEADDHMHSAPDNVRSSDNIRSIKSRVRAISHMCGKKCLDENELPLVRSMTALRLRNVA